MLVKKIPDITLIVTGHGIVEKELKKLADDLGVSHNIFWSGFVDMPTLAKLYKTADIFMIMSTAETQSLALMQAYATGIPGIGADNHGLKEYIPSRCGFRISHNDDKALACLVLELLTDDNKRISMGNAAEEFSRQFQPKIIADRWIDIYKKAIDTYHSQI
jgi:glycosyltransferase involved in cell wall biosynthesis